MADRLLRGGIAPRHVKRYVRELSDHFDDLVREALAQGKGRAEAERDAVERMGSMDHLTDAMLARDDLKAWGARYPRVVYGLGPIGSMVACLLVLIAILAALKALEIAPLQLATERLVFDVITGLYTYVLPPLLAVIFVAVGMRSRRDKIWIVIGATVLGVLGAMFTAEVEIFPAVVDGKRGILNFGFGVSPPEANPIVVAIKLAINLVVVAASLWVSTRWPRPAAS
jgi:hypothetical protein